MDMRSKSGVYVCEVCRQIDPEKEPFKVPADIHGEAIMRQHFMDEHPLIKLR